ncbi:MAG TPA: MarR family transcriptional regulator [Candidatus Saccharimonadia bacterium]|nr:MarR family transcriptional regulator [Candidatus Saccharimonadia bacterium]
MPSPQPDCPTGAAFLLTQLGTHAARRFGERIAPLGITPPHAGILRMIATIPECSQQQLAERLGILPSRMVLLIDELAEKGLVERRRSVSDRRNYELHLTKTGKQTLDKMQRLAGEHEADLLAALTADERATLTKLCQKVADQQGLTPGVHPGYRNL